MKPTIATALVASLSIISAANALDQNLPAYQTVPGISGQIKSVGSDTLNEAMGLWVKDFNQLYPDAKIIIEGRGSATAPPALLEGTSQFGPMSRSMNVDESTAFQKKYGHKDSDFKFLFHVSQRWFGSFHGHLSRGEPPLVWRFRRRARC